MTIVRRPSPFGELVTLRQAMDRLFEDSFIRPGRWQQATTGDPSGLLPLDVRMTGDELVVHAQLPGVKPEDVDVTIENGTLAIAADTSSDSQEEDQGFLVREIRRGSVSRAVALPDGLEADRATAEFENGVLTLHIPRAEQVKPRTIRITPTIAGKATDGTSSGSTPTESGDASNATGAASA
jgi:HSP20 family protein